MAFLDVIPGGICPQIQVLVDFVHDPTSTVRTWTDVTQWVTAYSRQPVRTNEFDQPGVTGASISLRNDDGRFLADNASGPYFGHLLPYRPVQVNAKWAGVTYTRFTGYIVDWPQSWDAAGHDQYVTVPCVDSSAMLESYDLKGQSFASASSVTVIGQITTFPGSPGMTGGGVPSSTIVALGPFPAGSFALQTVRDIAASENGVFFALGNGTWTFHTRTYRLVTALSSQVQATIGDIPGEIPYIDPAPLFGDVWPVVNVTPNGGTVQTAIGSTAYFPRTLNYPSAGTYLVASASEALGAAQYLAGRYSTPVTRVNSATLIGAQAPSLWPTILNLDTSTRVLFRRRPLINGARTGLIQLNQFIEGYADDVQIGRDWRVKVAMSPADTQTYWLLGDATYGVLGSTTRLFY